MKIANIHFDKQFVDGERLYVLIGVRNVATVHQLPQEYTDDCPSFFVTDDCTILVYITGDGEKCELRGGDRLTEAEHKVFEDTVKAGGCRLGDILGGENWHGEYITVV